ncbi:MAG: YbjN domain-containing protein, partial [Phycisphaerales bacterium]
AARAASLLPLLLDAGYEPEAESDDYICVRDPDTGFALFLTDFGGHRLELRCYFRVRDGLGHEAKADYARRCSEKLWAKYFIDADGDLVISHVVCCGGGLHQPNLMRTVRAFLSLCAYTLRECDPDGVVARGDQAREGGSS